MRPRCFLPPRADSGGYDVMTTLANTFYLFEAHNHILYLFWVVCFPQEKTLEHKRTSQLPEEDLCVLSPLCCPETHIYSGFPQKLEHVDSKDVEWSSQVPHTAIWGKEFPHAVQSVPAWAIREAIREVPPKNNVECLHVCVQIVSDLPPVSKLIHDLYRFSRAANLLGQITTNFPFTNKYSFFTYSNQNTKMKMYPFLVAFLLRSIWSLKINSNILLTSII